MCDVEMTNVGQQSDLQTVCRDEHNNSVTETRMKMENHHRLI